MIELLPLVLAGHFIGDWVVQTDYQAVAKASSWVANQRHMLGYHITLGALATLSLGVSWPLLVLISVSWITHSFIDRRWPVRWLMAHTGSRPFSETPWGVIAVDQALHLSILCITVAAIVAQYGGS